MASSMRLVSNSQVSDTSFSAAIDGVSASHARSRSFAKSATPPTRPSATPVARRLPDREARAAARSQWSAARRRSPIPRSRAPKLAWASARVASCLERRARFMAASPAQASFPRFEEVVDPHQCEEHVALPVHRRWAARPRADPLEHRAHAVPERFACDGDREASAWGRPAPPEEHQGGLEVGHGGLGVALLLEHVAAALVDLGAPGVVGGGAERSGQHLDRAAVAPGLAEGLRRLDRHRPPIRRAGRQER